MICRISTRAQQPLFLAREQDEADRALRRHAGSFDRPKRIDDQSGIAPVVQSSGAKLPGVEVRPQNDELLRLLAATKFSYDIGRFNGPADLIGNRQVSPYRISRG